MASLSDINSLDSGLSARQKLNILLQLYDTIAVSDGSYNLQRLNAAFVKAANPTGKFLRDDGTYQDIEHDVLEFSNFAAFPVTGQTGKIYISLATNFQYRWSGSAYVQITSGVASLADVLAVGNATNEIPIRSDNSNSFLTIWNTQIALEWANVNTGHVLIDDTKVAINHDLLINLTSPSVKKNGVELATFNDILPKPLTGLNITGSSITASDSILAAFGKLQNQINGVLGGAIYQGVWNATTNSPALSSGTGTKGYYYVVSASGSTNIDGVTDWKVGDWIIFNGTTWEKVDNTDAVSSVNGFIGAVNLTTDHITEVSNLYFTQSRVLSTLLTGYASGAGTVNSSDSVLEAIQKLNGNVALKQDALVSGTNIRTVNGYTLLGSTNLQVGTILGNITATAGLIPFSNGTTDTITTSTAFTFATATNTLKIGTVSTLFASEFVITKSTTSSNSRISIENTGVGNSACELILAKSSTDIGSIKLYSGFYSGNYTGTSLTVSSSLSISNSLNGTYGTGPIVLLGYRIYGLSGTISTDSATKLDSTGFRIGTLADIHATNTYSFQVNSLFYVDNGAVKSVSIVGGQLRVGNNTAGYAGTILASNSAGHNIGALSLLSTDSASLFFPNAIDSSIYWGEIRKYGNGAGGTFGSTSVALGGSMLLKAGSTASNSILLQGGKIIFSVAAGYYGFGMPYTGGMKIGKEDFIGSASLTNVSLHLDNGDATASYIKWTNGTTTNRTATDGFDVGITSTGVAQIIQRENADLEIYTNNVKNWSVLSTGELKAEDGKNILFSSTTGSKIGGSGSKLAFYNATPVSQQTTTVASATISAGSGNNLKDDDTFDGYTIAQIAKALRNIGIIA